MGAVAYAIGVFVCFFVLGAFCTWVKRRALRSETGYRGQANDDFELFLFSSALISLGWPIFLVAVLALPPFVWVICAASHTMNWAWNGIASLFER